jgi:hypothetical protein
MQNRVPRNKIAHAPQSTLRGLLEILSVSSMIPKNGNRFSEKIISNKKISDESGSTQTLASFGV